MKLSICVITMNRAEQLKEALSSCFACELPEDTEFIIVDNASTDNTGEMISQLQKETKYSIQYHLMSENLGVGIGRNKTLEYATGEYIYILDDDATIDENNPKFFIQALNLLEQHPEIATLTTQIYDTAWKANRLNPNGPKLFGNVYKTRMPCGGSHFLRRNYFSTPIYYPNKYGYEEFATAMQARKKGYENVYCEDLLIIHRPRIDKWKIKGNEELYINDFACQYAIKSVFYPAVITPLLAIMYNIRYYKYLRGSGLKKKGREIIKAIKRAGSDFERIDMCTFRSLLKDFGLSSL